MAAASGASKNDMAARGTRPLGALSTVPARTRSAIVWSPPAAMRNMPMPDSAATRIGAHAQLPRTSAASTASGGV